ncbi:Crp/Fnr family transcriptional regulator [Lutibacter sp.]|uniref:Crp/Fnr family transcriptional regulator n=1 Tax=Lutibacter sp. TaxID=1925666 RepID=UPI0025C30240|nr:Crp/Fnr family transcriptional regulator [Lutibacter sp.]
MEELYHFKNKNYKFNQNALFKKLLKIAKDKNTASLIESKIFDKGDFLVRENQLVTGFYFILKGKIKVYNSGSKNKKQILKLAAKGDLIGISAFNSAYYGASAVAEEKVEAYFITPKNLEILLSKYNDFSLTLIKALAAKVRNYEIRQKHLSLLSATERVIDALLLISAKFGVKTTEGILIEHCTSRKDISSFSSVSLENTIRTLSKLQKMNYIDIGSKLIVIKNKLELVNLIKKSSLMDYKSENN